MIVWVRVGIFVAATILIVWASLPSLRHPGSHGFWRFFAFEAIAALFALNVGGWFADPFSARQLLSWALLVVSLAVVLAAVRLLRRHGRSQVDRAGPRSAGAPEFRAGEYRFEQTTVLVTSGLYRRIRHPMYSSLLLLTWAIFLKAPSLAAAGLALAATAFLYLTARADEREDIARFGGAYVEYMRGTKRFIPWVW
jgi:protein-S-isoprenylcysteine O-methyltransferase Ste14